MIKIIALLLLLIGNSAFAEFDLVPYQSEQEVSDLVPREILYPEYFQRTDQLSLRNIMAELRFRFEFVMGIKPEPRYRYCYKMQKRIEKALERMIAAEKKLPFKFIDDALLFNMESPLAEYLKPVPLKINERCGYKSFGELGGSGIIYCVYHGLDGDSDFYKRHQHQFEGARPFITAFDIVELMIFLPAMLVLPLTWIIMKKTLEKKQVS